MSHLTGRHERREAETKTNRTCVTERDWRVTKWKTISGGETKSTTKWVGIKKIPPGQNKVSCSNRKGLTSALWSTFGFKMTAKSTYFVPAAAQQGNAINLHNHSETKTQNMRNRSKSWKLPDNIWPQKHLTRIAPGDLYWNIYYNQFLARYRLLDYFRWQTSSVQTLSVFLFVQETVLWLRLQAEVLLRTAGSDWANNITSNSRNNTVSAWASLHLTTSLLNSDCSNILVIWYVEGILWANEVAGDRRCLEHKYLLQPVASRRIDDEKQFCSVIPKYIRHKFTC